MRVAVSVKTPFPRNIRQRKLPRWSPVPASSVVTKLCRQKVPGERRYHKKFAHGGAVVHSESAYLPGPAARAVNMDAKLQERYSRQILFAEIGASGQERLRASSAVL